MATEWPRLPATRPGREGATGRSPAPDVIADPAGRVYCCTIPSPDHLGRLYCLGTDGTITDVTEKFTTIGIWGPNARDTLKKVVADPAGLDIENFPFAAIKPIEIAGKTVSAFRLSYVGEQGWELHGSPFASKGRAYQAVVCGGPNEKRIRKTSVD